MRACKQANNADIAANAGHDYIHSISALWTPHHSRGLHLTNAILTATIRISHQMRMLHLNGCIASGIELSSVNKGGENQNH